MSELDKIKARLEAATAGPWTYDGMHNEICTPNDIGGYWLIVSECRSSPDQVIRQNERGDYFDANFDLIAHMREDMVLLVAAVEATLGGSTPQQQMLTLAVCLGLETDSVRRQRMHDQKDAWEAIA